MIELFLVQSHRTHRPGFQPQQTNALIKSTVCCLPSTKQNTDKVSDKLVNVVKDLAAKKADMSCLMSELAPWSLLCRFHMTQYICLLTWTD